MIAVVSNLDNFKYLVDLGCHSGGSLMSENSELISRFFNEALQRSFIIFDVQSREQELVELFGIPLLRGLQSKGLLQYKYVDFDDHIEWSKDCRVIEFNDFSSEMNDLRSKENGHVCINLRESSQIKKLSRLFILDGIKEEGYSKSSFSDLPRVELPSNDIVIFDPYFPKGPPSSENTLDRVDFYANFISKFLNDLIRNADFKLMDSKYSIYLVVGTDNIHKSSLQFLDSKSRDELENKLNEMVCPRPLKCMIQLSSKLHDRGVIGTYCRYSFSSSFMSESAVDLFGLLASSKSYFNTIERLNGHSDKNFSFLNSSRKDLRLRWLD